MFDLLEPVSMIIQWCVLIIITLLLPINKRLKNTLIVLYLLYLHKFIRMIAEIIYPLLKILAGDKSYRRILAQKIYNKHNIHFKHNFHLLPQYTTILVCNYPISVFEYLIPHILPIPVCLVAVKAAENAIKLGYISDEYLLIDGKKHNNYEKLKEKISEIIKTRSIFIYAEDKSTRIYDFHVGKMRKGIFYIAKELGLPITPLAIDILTVSNATIPYQKFELRVGQTKKITDPIKSMHDIRYFLIRQKRKFQQTKFKIKHDIALKCV